MANTQQSPSLTTKLKTRDAANKIKHGSPKLQEVLRQRCRQRMKEKRGELFNKRRQGIIMETDEDTHETLTEILRQELSQLATLGHETDEMIDTDSNGPMNQDEALALENDFFFEEEQWIIQEYERMQQDIYGLSAFADEDQDIVFCPLCEKGLITETLGHLTCPMCNLRLPLKASLVDFGKMLNVNIELHSSRCRERPSFMVIPEKDTLSLYLVCETCEVLSIII